MDHTKTHHGKLYKFTCKYSNKKYVIINFECGTKKLCDIIDDLNVFKIIIIK